MKTSSWGVFGVLERRERILNMYFKGSENKRIKEPKKMEAKMGETITWILGNRYRSCHSYKNLKVAFSYKNFKRSEPACAGS
jgi:hypothetical protein